MKPDDFEDLAALWSASAPADDEAELRRIARHTPRVARLSQLGELVMVVLLAGVIMLSIVWNLGPATMLLGSLILILLAWSAWKRHHLGNLALLVAGGDRATYVRGLIQAKEAELKRSALGLAFILPGTFLTMLLGYALHQERGGGGVLAAFLLAAMTTARGLVTLGFLMCALMLLSLSHIRLIGELRRLRALLDEYETEARLDPIFGR